MAFLLVVVARRAEERGGGCVFRMGRHNGGIWRGYGGMV